MVQADALVTNAEKSDPFVRITLTTSALAPGLAPGRFVLADLGGYLRTPLFPAHLEARSFEILVHPDHPAAAVKAGATVNLVGPLGEGFKIPLTTQRLLLVADTAHLPVLLPLVRPRNQAFQRKPGFSIALLLSAPTAADLYPIRLLPPALEVHIATADGSTDHQDSALDLFSNLVGWADCVCIAADPATYPSLAEVVREVRMVPTERFAQALVVPPMACGVGACQGCAVPVARGTKLACTEGPVFNLLELR